MSSAIVKRYKLEDIEDIDVNPVKLLDYLYFEEDGLSQAALEQPTLMFAAIRYKQSCLRTKVKRQSAYETMKSLKSLRIRRKLGESRKTTEAVITAHLVKDEDLNKAKRLYQKAELAENLASGILEAFKQRRDMIKTLSDLSRNDTTRQLWALEKVAKDKKLRDTAKLLRSRARTSAMEEDEDIPDYAH